MKNSIVNSNVIVTDLGNTRVNVKLSISDVRKLETDQSASAIGPLYYALKEFSEQFDLVGDQ